MTREGRSRDNYSIFYSTNEGIVILGLDHHIVDANPAMLTMTGYEREEFVGRKCYRVMHNNREPCKEVPCTIKEVLEKGEVKGLIHTHWRKDGSRWSSEISAAPLTDGESNMKGVVEVERDITERLEMEESLRRSKERLQTIIENEPECVKVVDVDGTLLDMNPAGLAMIEADSLEQVLGKSVIDIVSPEHRDAFREFLQDVYRGNKAIFEFRIIGLKGTSHWLESHAVPIEEEESAVRILAITRDITEYKKKKERIEAMSELSSVVASTMDMERIFEIGYQKIGKVVPQQLMMVALADEETSTFQITFIGAERQTDNIKKGTVIPFADTEVLTSVYGKGQPAMRGDLESKEELCPLDKKLIKEGIKSYLWIPLISKEKYIGALCMGSYNKENFSEEQIQIAQEFANQLAVGIEDAQLFERLQRELAVRKETQKKIEESNRMKDLFTDVLHHDLANPITTASNFVDFLLEDESPSQKIEHLGRVKKNLTRAEEIMEDAREISKLEGAEKLERKEMDLKEVIQGVVASYKPVAEEGGMEIENRVTERMEVRAHHSVGSVFSNLLSNALKYGKEGKRVILDMGEGEGKVRVKVIDFGKGVPDDYREEIFNRFKRRKKEGVKGIGLGLAIAKRIVELHNGRIWVEDTLNGGATFVVEIPIRERLFS